YQVDHSENKFIVVTNWEAVNFRLMETPLHETTRENWKEMIGHRADVLLQGVDPFKDHLVITERKNGLVQLRFRNVLSGHEHYLDFDEPAYAVFAGANPEYNTTNLRYNFTSLKT